MPNQKLMPFTAWSRDHVFKMLQIHANDLGDAFAIDASQFHILTMGATGSRNASTAAFDDVFDTSSTHLVDAYEVLIGLAMLSRMELADKLNFAFGLFDYNGSAMLSIDEVTVLMRTFVGVCAKMDSEGKVAMQPTPVFEELSSRAFTYAGKEGDEAELTKVELDAFCNSSSIIREFLDFTNQGVARVEMREGAASWADLTFQGAGALYADPSKPPLGALPGPQVKWRRLARLAKGDQVCLISDGGGSGTVLQGAFADRWLLNAVVLVCSRPALVQQLFLCTGQEDKGRYCARLSYAGSWVNVYVDDRMPCSGTGAPLCSRSGNPAEVWISVLEKACAKMHGSYEALASTGPMAGDTHAATVRRLTRTTADGLIDLTGGHVETIDLDAMVSGKELDVEVEAAVKADGDGEVRHGDTKKAKKGLLGFGRRKKADEGDQMDEDEEKVDVAESSAESACAARCNALWANLATWARRDLLGCCRVARPRPHGAKGLGLDAPHVASAHGVLRDHAYTVEDAVEVRGRRFVRLRTRWAGRGGGPCIGAWRGAWGEGSAEWEAEEGTDERDIADVLTNSNAPVNTEAKTATATDAAELDTSAVADAGAEAKATTRASTIARNKRRTTKKQLEEERKALIAAAKEAKEKEAISSRTFWMSWDDWLHTFNVLYRCRVFAFDAQHTVHRIESRFPSVGGGCVRFDTWRSNPQIALHIERKTELAVTLYQEDRMHAAESENVGATNASAAVASGAGVSTQAYTRALGFFIARYDWGSAGSPAFLPHVHEDDVVAVTSKMKCMRTACQMVTLSPGKYMLVPMSFEPDQPGQYWVRVDADSDIALVSSHDTPFVEPEGSFDASALDSLRHSFVKVSAGEATEQKVVPEGAAERSLAFVHGLTEDLASLARVMEAKKKRLGARVALLEAAD